MACHPQHYRELAEIISKLFGYAVSITDVRACAEGVNKDAHFVARTEKNEQFGLKLFERTGSVFGAEKDKLMADIACLAGLPNACRVERSGDLGFIEEFAGKVISITKWLPGSTSLKRLVDDEVWIEILDSADAFHFQSGQWMSFGYAFAIADRGIGNWVWNHTSRQLAMIDMEFALHEPSLADFNELLGRFLTKHKEKGRIRKQQLEAIHSGFLDGWGLLRSKSEPILNALAAESFAKDYLVPLNQEASQIITPHLEAYGL